MHCFTLVSRDGHERVEVETREGLVEWLDDRADPHAYNVEIAEHAWAGAVVDASSYGWLLLPGDLSEARVSPVDEADPMPELRFIRVGLR